MGLTGTLLVAIAVLWPGHGVLAAAPEAEDYARHHIPDKHASPDAVISAFESLLMRHMQTGDAADSAERFTALQPVVKRVFNIDRMAFFLFGTAWTMLSPAERDRFATWFENLTTATYASRFNSFRGQRFERVSAEQRSERRARVTTLMRRPDKDPVEFVYLMGHGDTGWQVINVVANGVSDLAIRRSQYRRLFEGGGMQAVIETIQAEIEQLEDE